MLTKEQKDDAKALREEKEQVEEELKELAGYSDSFKDKMESFIQKHNRNQLTKTERILLEDSLLYLYIKNQLGREQTKVLLDIVMTKLNLIFNMTANYKLAR
jgi:hypothetical protein